MNSSTGTSPYAGPRAGADEGVGGGAVLSAGAIIVAAGEGKRMRLGMSHESMKPMEAPSKKQYLPLLGVPILGWTLRAFFMSDAICEVVLVVAEDDIGYCGQAFGSLAGGKRFRIVAGGATRQASVAAGARALSGACAFIAVHDGVRPFINCKLIRDGVEAAARSGASCVAVPVTETIKTARDGFIESTPDRSALWAAQTPQTFRRGLLIEALEKAEHDGFAATDDVSMAERLGARVEIVPGSYDNIKITTIKDIATAREIAARFHV